MQHSLKGAVLKCDICGVAEEHVSRGGATLFELDPMECYVARGTHCKVIKVITVIGEAGAGQSSSARVDRFNNNVVTLNQSEGFCRRLKTLTAHDTQRIN